MNRPDAVGAGRQLLLLAPDHVRRRWWRGDLAGRRRFDGARVLHRHENGVVQRTVGARRPVFAAIRRRADQVLLVRFRKG